MTDAVTTNAPAATTSGPAPTTSDTSASTTSAATTQSPPTTPADSDPLYAVPETYLKDGQPDYREMTKGYNTLRQKLSDRNLLAPDTVDGYKLESEAFEGVEFDDERLKPYREEAHKLGITNKAFNWMMEKYVGSLRTEAQSKAQEAEQQVETLQQEWGHEFEGNMDHAIQALETFAGIKVGNEPIPGISGNTAVLKILAAIGKELGEDRGTLRSSPTSTLTKTQIDELRNRPDYWTNKDVQAQVDGYYERMAALGKR